MQSAWAILLSEQSGSDDVVFGATFSGRPAELPDVEVHHWRVRQQSAGASATSNATPRSKRWPDRLQTQLMELAEHQHLPLREIQELSAVPLRSPLFQSLLVFQNYTIDDSAMQWADDVRVTDLVAPVRTNFPLTLVVNPGRASLDLDLVFQGGFFDDESARRMLDALCTAPASRRRCADAVGGCLP